MLEPPKTEIPTETEWIGRRVIGCAITVHRELGPGFKESIYQRALCLELDSQGFAYESEKSILVRYKQREIPGQRLDLIVAGCLLVELKAIPRLRPLHSRQVVSYLKSADLRLGFLINFKVNILMPQGFRRIVVWRPKENSSRSFSLCGLRVRVSAFHVSPSASFRVRRPPRGS